MSLAATGGVTGGASATTMTTAQIRSQYPQDLLPVSKALASPVSAGGPSDDQINANRVGIKATIVKFDSQLQALITTFNNQVADYDHESPATLQTAVAEGIALSSEQIADTILIADIYAEPNTPVKSGLSCTTADLTWSTRVIDDALILTHYQGAVVADFGDVPSFPSAFHVVAQNTAVGSGADANINTGVGPYTYTGRQELIVTATPSQSGELSWNIGCFEAGGAMATNQGQINVGFPGTKRLTLPAERHKWVFCGRATLA